MSFRTQAKKTSYYEDGRSDGYYGLGRNPPPSNIRARLSPPECYEIGYLNARGTKPAKRPTPPSRTRCASRRRSCGRSSRR